MHHGSYIRENIESKYMNSSANVNAGYRKQVPDMIREFNEWTPGKKARVGATNPTYLDVIPKNQMTV